MQTLSFHSIYNYIFTFFFLIISNVSYSEIEIEVTNTLEGCCKGTISITVEGTAGPFIIQLFKETGTPPGDFVDEVSGINGTHIFTDLCEADYLISITNLIGCETSLSTSVGVYAIVIEESISCICTPDGYGSIDLEVTGNTDPYTFNWTGPNGFSSTDQDLDRLENNGSYYVTVTDNNGCTASRNFDVNYCNFDFPAFTEELGNDCDGQATGFIEVSVPVNNLLVETPLAFVWFRTDGPQPVPGQITSDPLAASSRLEQVEGGNYCLTVLSNNGCQAHQCWTIESYDCPTITYDITPVVNGSDGIISLNVQGNSGPYTYDWGLKGITGPTRSGLSPGTYGVVVAYGDAARPCTKSLSFEVMDCQELENNLSLSTEVTPMQTASSNDGKIDLTVTNGAGYNLSYAWQETNSGQSWNTEDLAGLAAGEYCVTVTEANCSNVSLSTCVEICSFGLRIAEGELSCTGALLSANISGGSGPFTYNWSNGGSTSSINGLLGATYSLTVTGGSRCTATAEKTISFPPMSAQITTTNATMGQSNGSATVTAGGGLAPYTYSWSNGMSGATITNIPSGEYCVTVTDVCGLSSEACGYVECELPPSDVVIQATDVDCGGNSMGNITITLNYPDPNNTFLWSTGATTQNLSNLPAGEYCVTIVNVTTNCSLSECVEIASTGEGDLDVAFDRTVGCFGGSNGELVALPSGGTTPYTYLWQNYWQGLTFTTQTISNIPAGWYALTVTDAIGCTVSDFTFLSAIVTVSATVDVDPPAVCEGESATVTMEGSGGDAPYTYYWRASSSQTVNTAGPATGPVSVTLSTPANYFLTVEDSEGCEKQTWFKMEESPEMSVTAEVQDECDGGANGSISLLASGSRPPYNYIWSNGSSTATVNNLRADNYSVTVTDGNGCTSVQTYTIDNNTGPNVTFNNCGTYIGAIVIGSSPFTYLWSTGESTTVANNLTAGLYSITVTDSNGCFAIRQQIVSQEDIIEISILTIRGATLEPPDICGIF